MHTSKHVSFQFRKFKKLSALSTVACQSLGFGKLAEQGEDIGNKNLILSTHGPLSRSEVLQGSRGGLQGVVVLAAREERQVEPHHLRLVEQLQTFSGRW